VRTAFSIVNFSALERCLVDQFETLCLMRFTIVVNRSFFLLLKCSGCPSVCRSWLGKFDRKTLYRPQR
ncbi:unnamed protein product, partial [Brassica oleracea var. botrytis]